MKVLVSEAIALEARIRLEANSNLTVCFSKNPQPTSEEIRGSDILLIRSRTRIDAEFLSACRELKLIVSMTAGFDHIDLKEVSSRRIVCVYTPESHTQSTAELTMALLLALHRSLPSLDRDLRQGKWREGQPRGCNLAGRRLGIIGFGRIGRRVGHLAKAFGMHVSAYDPYLSSEDFDNQAVERLGLHEILRCSDAVTLHVPFTPATKGMINNGTLEWMRPGTLLINTSRGEVCKQAQVFEALQKGVLGGLALDVFENEPFRPIPQWRELPRSVFTPHVGAYTEAAFELASAQGVDAVEAFLSGLEPKFTLPPQALWYQEAFN